MERGVPLMGRPALFFFLLGATHCVAPASAAELHDDPGWRALLHYDGGKSEADSPDFFLAPDGKKNPQAELEATLRAFRDPDPDPGNTRYQHPQCRFPARWKFLKQKGADVPAERHCPRFAEWRAQLDPEGVVMVFADAFMANPASMYGHTFLRLKKKGSVSGEELLDYTINYAGTPDTDNALFYAVKGLLGAFPGNYSTMPYYLKTAEYNDIEKRDLWEYELELSSRAIDMLVRHAWEMGSTYFDYYFFDENCSYQLLTLLDAAEPSLGSAEKFGLWVIPMDTVRVFLDKGLVKSVKRRPSFAAEAEARRGRKPADEKQAEALRLEAEYDKWKLAKGEKKDPAKGKRLLAERAKLGVGPIDWTMPEKSAPHEGHRSGRVGVGLGAKDKSSYSEFLWRAALHDLAENPDGFIPGSQLEMGDTSIRVDNERSQVYVERFDLIDIVSLSHGGLSWKAVGGVDQAKELGRIPAASHVGRVNAGLGSALKIGPHYVYLFGEVEAGAGPVLRKGWRAGGGGTAGLVLTFPRLRLQAEGTLLSFDDHERLKVTASYDLRKNLQLRLHADRETPAKEAGLALLLHY
jgi:hypothetical protein